jgi:multidrug efflux pump subunit AcrA (membrane-fusion protein)
VTTDQGSGRRHLGSRWPAAALAAVVAVGAAAAIAFAVSTAPSGYRTAPATFAPVVKTVAVTGTVEPINRVTLAFGVSGTVAKVAVHVGERVAAGQTLATLQTTTLAQQVTQAQASLRAAQATVTADEQGQSTAGSGGTTARTRGGETGTQGHTSVPDPSKGTPTTLASAQQAVVSAQRTADAAARAAAGALSAADTACGSSASSGTGTGTGESPGPASTTSTTAPSGTAGASACATALHDALGAQQTLAADQRAVTGAETSLAALLAKGGTPTGGGTGTTGTRSPGSTTGTAPTTKGATGATGSGGTAAPATPKAQAAQLASDQAAVDTDDAKLLVAQQSLAEAALASPIAGTVGAVNVAAGQSTTAGSSTAAVTILTQHTFEAEGLVSPTQVPALAVGDIVRVGVDGRPSPIRGRVIRIGPVDTSLGFQYPVVVALPSGIPHLFTGSLCQMTVVVHLARHTLAVPNSAVRTSHGKSYVTVVQGGRGRRVSVGVGIVGDQETQILSGLRRGQQVALASLTRPLPKPSSGTGSHGRQVPEPFPYPGGGRFFIVGNGNNGVVFSGGPAG